jgi:hypothetical protein
MIARLWHGAVPSARGEDDLRYLERTGLPYPEDRDFLVELEPTVTRYEVEAGP